jgi:glutamyl-tRNA synthetase
VLVTRIAPTPSGHLHVGNAVNALLTAWLARSSPGGRLLLRVDDFDTGRAREAYLADVFDTLAWLGITPDDGPTDPADFHARWSMARHAAAFRAAAQRLWAEHPEVVFTCRCSRRDLVAGGCAAGCRALGLPLQPGGTVLRLHVPDGLVVRTAPGPARAATSLPVPAGDHVLWRRDDLPAYQLGSVLADEALGVTAIVRGVDLLDSSALQLHLAALLPARAFARVDLRHHALLTDPSGAKLSKSAGAQAHPLERTDALRRRVESWAEQLGAPLGITPPPTPP